MSVLQDIFENVRYEEISPLFDEMESMFLSLTDGYRLDLSEEVTDSGIYQRMEQLLTRWEENVQRRSRDFDVYFELSRDIYRHIERSYINSREERQRELFEDLESLSQWIYDNHDFSLGGLLYHSQRMTQLRRIIELYQKDASKNILTLRHLFEQGLKRVRVKADRYMEYVFDIAESRNTMNYSILSFLSFVQPEGHTRFREENINWVTDRSEATRIEELLSRNLKYADLARRKHTTIGNPVEILDSYEIHFPRYGGKNIKGRFHLQGNMNGFIGTRRGKENTIVVGFAGTEPLSPKNWWTDARQYFGYLDPVYVQAAALVNAVWMGKRHKAGFEDSPIIVCGHSLGGGLMQYAVASMNKEDITGYGYNSAGLSSKNVNRLDPIEYDKIFHLYQPNDVVFTLSSCKQLGKSVKMGTVVTSRCKAHCLDTMRRNLRAHRREIAKLG